MRVDVRPCREADAALLVDGLRAADRREGRALIGPLGDLEEAVRRSILLSPDARSVWAGEELLFVIGCADGGDHGQPWLLATDAAASYPKAMTQVTKQRIVGWLERWPRLANYVDARNVTSVRWLARVGFNIGETKAMGAAGELFHLFTMEP